MIVEAFISQFYTRMNVTEEEVDNFIKKRVDEFGQIEYDLIEFVIEEKINRRGYHSRNIRSIKAK